MYDIYEVFAKLCAVRSQSGGEKAAAEIINSLAKPYADEIGADALGNLTVRKKGDGKKLMLCAHMDEIGFIVTGIDDNGFVRAAPVGGIYSYEMIGLCVEFQHGARGVIYKEEKIKIGDLKSNGLYIDIGCKTKKEAAEVVKTGDLCGFCGNIFNMGTRLCSPYMDDKIGCALLLAALSRAGQSGYDLYFTFTTQEELGLRGARAAAYGISPDYAFAVDVAPATDTPGDEEHNKISLGGGPVSTVMDRSFIAHPEAREMLETAAKKSGVSLQYEVTSSGGTDAGAIHTSRGGVKCGGISVPVRYVHTPVETIEKADADACLNLLCSLISV